jgi:hypothetical protein
VRRPRARHLHDTDLQQRDGQDAPRRHRGHRYRLVGRHRIRRLSDRIVPVQRGNGDDRRDAVDAIVDEWRRERPDLDPSAKEITGRVSRLASLFQQAYSDAFSPLGLNDGDYGVLAPLLRAGAPHELTPTELAKHRMMTSGGMNGGARPAGAPGPHRAGAEPG